MQNSFVLFGARCSGTNIIEAAIAANSSLQPTWEFGFKHFPIRATERATERIRNFPVLIVCREPVEWLRSLYAQPWHAAPEVRARPFSDFLVSEWWSIWSEDAGITREDPRYGAEMLEDRNPDSGERYANPIAMRTSKAEAFFEFGEHARSLQVVRLEDYIAAPEDTIVGLLDSLGVPRPRRIKIPSGYKGQLSVKRKLLRLLGIEGLFPRKRFRAKPAVGCSERSLIASMLDASVELRLGYGNSLRPSVTAPRGNGMVALAAGSILSSLG